MTRPRPPWRRVAVYYAWVLTMAFFFANAEIQIEGGAGWATSLPTWRVEKHWLLDLFWGGRAMSGYHAWVFSFMALVFFMPLAFQGRWRGRDMVLALGGLAAFWVTEDLLWFVVNPAFGFARLDPVHAFWHPHWLLGLPVDYWWGALMAVGMGWWHVRLSARARRDAHARAQRNRRRSARPFRANVPLRPAQASSAFTRRT